MGLLIYAGCLLLAYGPSVAILVGLVSKQSYLFILAVTAAFFWLITALLSSLVWVAIPPLKSSHWWTIVASVAIGELIRFWFLSLYTKAEERIVTMVPAAAKSLNDLSASISAGLGYSIMQSVLMYGAVISSSQSEGTLYLDECPQMSLFVLDSLLWTPLHLFLMINALDAWRRGTLFRKASVVATHLVASYLSLLNKTKDGCVAMIPCLLVLVLGVAVWTYAVVTAPEFLSRRGRVPTPAAI